MLTIRPPASLSDIEAKKYIQRKKLVRLGEKLERHGQLSIAVTVFEKKPGGVLHSHTLIYVHPDNLKDIERFADWCNWLRGGRPENVSVEIHARRIDDINGASEYVLKQHRHSRRLEWGLLAL
jgi:hypothetical protein